MKDLRCAGGAGEAFTLPPASSRHDTIRLVLMVNLQRKANCHSILSVPKACWRSIDVNREDRNRWDRLTFFQCRVKRKQSQPLVEAIVDLLKRSAFN